MANKSSAVPSNGKLYPFLSISCAVFGVLAGYLAGHQPSGAGWRFFSYHPFLMTIGFITFMGNAALVKKRGGYVNTKRHAILSGLGFACALGGWFVIYRNKDSMGRPHLTSNHSLAGITTLITCGIVGLVGSIGLHPDFGRAKTNIRMRFMHKWIARIAIAGGWITCFTGLKQLTSDWGVLGTLVVPLLILAPFTLI
eukprot:CAMPEP_0195523422 /NCGR_PEP_ID=MMETSP0794_2-20130614/22601_1 /TAXON_ID=515487 /ORGANISM="Stephanopyxis turris, Strain CCMP 815" /LENGTH=196 /DNA_ID=CAMNT_0040653423 /DNA_START=163 /DNA_END=753 /DNA_ORIENTATION=+